MKTALKITNIIGIIITAVVAIGIIIMGFVCASYFSPLNAHTNGVTFAAGILMFFMWIFGIMWFALCVLGICLCINTEEKKFKYLWLAALLTVVTSIGAAAGIITISRARDYNLMEKYANYGVVMKAFEENGKLDIKAYHWDGFKNYDGLADDVYTYVKDLNVIECEKTTIGGLFYNPKYFELYSSSDIKITFSKDNYIETYVKPVSNKDSLYKSYKLEEGKMNDVFSYIESLIEQHNSSKA